jgi:HEAT repeat protein
MELDQIEAGLKSSDSQSRLKAIAQLNQYDCTIAVPLLLSKLHDPVFLVRSFVAMGLGKQQTADSFAALLELIKFDRDPNVRAEAANSLSLFGKVAISHLVQSFYQDDQWLVRRSILAALMELDCPEEVFDISLHALSGEDLSVREAAIDCFGSLAGSIKHNEALEQLLLLKGVQEWRMRLRVAYALKKFAEPEAKAALNNLMPDENHRVVAAALEASI